MFMKQVYNCEIISGDIKNTVEKLKQRNNIIGLSGGKDSVATCILLHRLGIPFKTVTAEVWWDNNTIGEHPLHYDFLHNIVVPKFQSWGIQCDFVRSNITAYQYMTTPIAKSTKHPERIGKLRGFVLCGRCGIQRDCKTKPCEKYYKSQTEPFNIITGIASNEKSRLLSNEANNRLSLLGLLRIEEWQTYQICKSEDLLSPTYNFSNRGGCWFCPNQKIQELELLYRLYPELWEKLMEIQRMPNKVQEKFNRTQTLYDIENEIKNGVQIKWFEGDIL